MRRTLAHLGFLLLLLHTGCANPFKSGTSPRISSVDVSGVAALGRVSGGTIRIYTLNPDGSQGNTLATTTTSGDGSFQAKLLPQSAPIGFELTGGSYLNEGTGEVRSLQANESYHAFVPEISHDEVITVTPLTEMVTQQVLNTLDSTPLAAETITQSYSRVAAAAGVPNIDLLRTPPADVSSPAAFSSASREEKQVALLLAGFSKQAATLEARSGATIKQDDLVAAYSDVLNGDTGTLQAGNTTVTVNTTTWQDLPVEIAGYASANPDTVGNSITPDIIPTTAVSTPPVVPVLTVKAPTFSVASGTYTTARTVTLSSATPGAALYYTIDGTAPTSFSTPYILPITVSSTQTIKAIATKFLWLDSSIASGDYTITGTVATPTFSPTAGTFFGSQSVSITSATAGATIYYTTNGATPTTSSSLYSGALTISSTITLKAIAVKTGTTDSSVASGTFTVSTTPTGLIATAGNGSVTLDWDVIPSASAYHLYWNTAGSPTTSSNKLVNVTPGYTHYHLTKGTAYYYVVTAVVGGVETAVSYSVSATPEDAPLAGPVCPNAGVNTVHSDGGDVYFGGAFTLVGRCLNGGVPLGTASGKVAVTYSNLAQIQGSVNAVVSDGANGWYVGGAFSTVGGATRNNIAHISSDGSLDPDWNPNANNVVFALALSSSTLYVGGNFTTIGGQSRNYLAALSAAGNGSTGSADATWNPGPSNPVSALLVSGSFLYVGGVFTSIGGQTRRAVAALSLTGSGNVDATWNPNPTISGSRASPLVDALQASGSKLYVGGSFTAIGGQSRNRIAALSLAGNGSIGSADATWNPNSNSSVRALVISGSTLYAGGDFTSIGGQTRNRIAALSTSGTGSADASWDPNAGNNSVLALALSGSTLYVGGSFTSLGGTTRNGLAAVGTDGTLAAWNPYPDTAGVNALAVSGPTIYVGGTFTSLGPAIRNYAAAVDSEGGLTSWNPNADNSVTAIAVSGSTVYVGGIFTTIGGQSRPNLAVVSATTGTADATWNPSPNGRVRTLLVSVSTLYVGGDFTTIGGQNRNFIAALSTSGTGSADATWNPNADASVCSFALSGTTLYAAGSFNHIGGQTRFCAAALDTTGTGSADANWNPTANNVIWSIALSGSTLYAAGSFTSIGGQTRNNLAALDATLGDGTHTGSADATWNPSAGNTVRAVAVFGSTVYAGGDFLSIGGQSRNGIAALNASGSGAATSWDPHASGTVLSLFVSGPIVFVGTNTASLLSKGRSLGAYRISSGELDW